MRRERCHSMRADMRVPLMRMGPNAGRLNRRDSARSAIVYRLPPGGVCRQAARAARHLHFFRAGGALIA
ncbi:hypothetical protein D2V84_26655 [Burkholderia pseudomallei]|nr:hypothetical protein D2W72_26230 [Burkholderia pseudomallei]RIV67948.1 hypothetical protein D2V84_26655 [Burkholderia pseudomallei]